MSVAEHQLIAAQLAATVGSLAQQLRAHRAALVAADPTLATGVDAVLTALDSGETALGKIAWGPLPVPPVSPVAGGG